MSNLFWPEKQEKKEIKTSMWSWKQTHIQRPLAMTARTLHNGWFACWSQFHFANYPSRSPKDFPNVPLESFKGFFLDLIVPGGKGREGGGGGVHLKCTKINANSIFKRKLPATLSRTGCWMYSKCLHARWHRHWSWLGVSLCGSSVRRQEHSGNCELSQTRQSTGFFFFF